MLRTVLCALLIAGIGVCVADDSLLRLRHSCYLVLVPDETATLRADFNCIPHGTYPDWLEYTLYDRSGDEVAWGQVPPGAQAVLDVRVKTPGLHVLELTSGWNLATCALSGPPWAFVVSSRLPLQTVGEVPRLYFHVPAGLRSFGLFAQSSVTREGIRVEVLAPDGRVTKVLDGDADRLEKLDVDVPAGQDGAEWSVRVTAPQTPGMNLDDCLLYLGDSLPPFLAPTAEAVRSVALRGDWQ
ncbi:MAG: hypothetical protein HPY44_18100 [Armatimonadetes bacterium]|nr:hypothetical protein [Armatimonadota bacterium]